MFYLLKFPKGKLDYFDELLLSLFIQQIGLRWKIDKDVDAKTPLYWQVSDDIHCYLNLKGVIPLSRLRMKIEAWEKKKWLTLDADNGCIQLNAKVSVDEETIKIKLPRLKKIEVPYPNMVSVFDTSTPDRIEILDVEYMLKDATDPRISYLIDQYSRIPGWSEKTATRLISYLGDDAQMVLECFGDDLIEATKLITQSQLNSFKKNWESQRKGDKKEDEIDSWYLFVKSQGFSIAQSSKQRQAIEKLILQEVSKDDAVSYLRFAHSSPYWQCHIKGKPTFVTVLSQHSKWKENGSQSIHPKSLSKDYQKIVRSVWNATQKKGIPLQTGELGNALSLAQDIGVAPDYLMNGYYSSLTRNGGMGFRKYVNNMVSNVQSTHKKVSENQPTEKSYTQEELRSIKEKNPRAVKEGENGLLVPCF